MRHIFWAGDSTVADNKASTFPQTGIGQAFDRYTAPDVVVYNHAVNGRSTKSFIDQSRLAVIYNEIGKGDYLFIQFGHNDEKEMDPDRYTDPNGEFINNLEKFANVARNKGAYPVYITPVERRLFDENGKLKPSGHTEYVKAMKVAGERFDVPVVDLFSMSRAFLEEMGDVETKKYFMNLEPGEASWKIEGQEDNTHLKYEGAMLFAGMVAKGLSDLGEPYSTLVVDFEKDRETEPEKIEVNG